MRKLTVFLFLFLTIMSSKTFAQSLVGIYGGVNNSTFHHRDIYHFEADYESKPTYIFGIHCKERRNNYVNMTWSIDYVFRSVKIEQIMVD